MAFADFWEVADGSDQTTVWRKLIGSDREDVGETEHQLDVILEGAPIAAGRALEIGAGIGRLMVPLLARGRFQEIHGVDSSSSLVRLGQAVMKPGLSLVLSDGVSLPYPDDYFDFVYSFTTFQHMLSLATIRRNLREVWRVLRRGGTCRVQTVASGERDPRDLATFDGRVFNQVEHFSCEFEIAGLTPIQIDRGLTAAEHIWVTAVKGMA